MSEKIPPGVTAIDYADNVTGAPLAEVPTDVPSSNASSTDDSDISSHDAKQATRLEKTASHVSQMSHATRLSHLIRPRTRRSSFSSDDSDPLEPLELAMTPNIETEAEQAAREPISHAMTATSFGSVASRLPDFEVTFDDNGSDDPRQWPVWYRFWIVAAISYSTWVVVVYSTSYTSSIPGVMEAFNVSTEAVAMLGVTTYLFGLAVGAMVVAPMSEIIGRRNVYLVCIVCFTLLVIPSALATSLGEILAVRFFGAFFGAALVANGPATMVDISTDDNRALFISVMSIAPMNGPVTGPLIGGFVYEYLGWRWDSYIVIILGGVAIAVMFTVRETYAPAILKAKAAKKRKEMDDDRYWCRYDERISVLQLVKTNLSRPFVLAVTEPILWFFNFWLSIVYGILYLCFVAYPIVFTEGRGWSAGISGLAFLGIGIGTVAAIASEPLCRRLINSYPKDPETGRAPPEASARCMIIGAVLTPIGQLVFSWTGLPATIHWAVPIAFGTLFGAGNTITFIYGSNYLAGSYGMYAASALASNMVIRSVIGGTLPLAGPTMYKAMTPQWAGTFLGLLEVCLIPIPIIFLKYGKQIRGRSRVIRQMRADVERTEAKRAKLLRILARQQAKREREEAAAATRGSGSDASQDGDRGMHSIDLERTADIDEEVHNEKTVEPVAAPILVPSKE
ncbi:major facilitator superfamily transporter [Ophiostoma piceae UAMH 11346]|uniref:Major facilitator superfamily transporter n=1 Tax=Ophiostoma piceae (strain UAMH 11346) TaxID=1262450 RepID=S3CSK9_OPHP1|nr:major facilitator superfamily transporter [Ophiostoma piceae UAMH 11346]